MKIKSASLVFILFASALFGQFKEVKTANDVIDNYIKANGGADNLKSVKSISMEGNMNIADSDVPMKLYTGNDIFYMNFAHTQFGVTLAIDTKNKKGWTKFGSMVKDATPDEIEKNKENIASTLWAFYLEPAKYGITYELMQNEKVVDKDAYVVDFKSKDSVVQTVYFDAGTFQRVKQIKGKTSSEYLDLRDVSSSGIYMPYKISTNQGEVIVTKYEFNTKLDKKLLKRPKDKEKKEEGKE